MASEKLVTATGAVLFAVLAVFIWQDYVAKTNDAYDALDAAKAQVSEIAAELRDVEDGDTFMALNAEQNGAEIEQQRAQRRINEIDGWGTLEWRLKNTIRFASPAAAVLCTAFFLLSVLNPLKRDG